MAKELGEMLDDLREVDEITWGLYAFSRDILKDRVPYEEKVKLIREAIQCGKNYAHRTGERFASQDPKEIARELGLKIDTSLRPMGPERVVFALFTPPDKITVMEEPLKPLNQEQKQKVTDVLIFHEIFHYLEEENKSEIFTRTKKILLWKIGPIKNESTINALSEIAAMAFCRELCELEISPFALDVFLYYGYDQDRAYDLYDEIMGISEKVAV